MIKKYSDQTKAIFIIYEKNKSFNGLDSKNSIEPLKTLIYNEGKEQKINIDGIEYDFPEMSFLFLIMSQNFTFENPTQVTVWQFNREFYCIWDQDTQVGCAGFLCYGINHPMFIKLTLEDCKEIKYLKERFEVEWKINDRFHGEMLKTLLKHLIIKITRKVKLQSESYENFSEDKLEIVRKLAILIELNYKKEHRVKFYADALNKSPKTLSNIFAILKQVPPSKIIQNRIYLEAKRYLNSSDKTAKEIAFELGFESLSSFSRFFKKQSGINISNFKK